MDVNRWHLLEWIKAQSWLFQHFTADHKIRITNRDIVTDIHS
ncbi:Uncharacterised protein [Vibrio cholerae]|uniref:Uncharacterized protein n=1 Tax=Vibrio cholerae TaxID=666 RepID=A0A656B0N6_VIBCL|nr:Uncharacterised protein [Vibrio cholerae]CSC86783.1 Uncharacterised protein [Vibrio cholerae]CSD66357.1 Uncharacterised protein [Vibrio cholerae]